jgi:hypothetical protein
MSTPGPPVACPLAQPAGCCDDTTTTTTPPPNSCTVGPQPPIQFTGHCADFGAGACDTQSIPFTSATWLGGDEYNLFWGSFAGAYVSLVYNTVTGIIYSDAGGNTIGSCTNIGANFIPYCAEFSDPGNCEGSLVNLHCTGGTITGTLAMGVYVTDCYNGGVAASMTFG